MKGAAEFYTDWLVDNGEGFLVTPVGTSPENTFYTKDGQTASVGMGVTMDMAMIRELFTRTAEASEILDIDPEFRKVLQDKLPKLLKHRNPRTGICLIYTVFIPAIKLRMTTRLSYSVRYAGQWK